jgi:hypothetical protein
MKLSIRFPLSLYEELCELTDFDYFQSHLFNEREVVLLCKKLKQKGRPLWVEYSSLETPIPVEPDMFVVCSTRSAINLINLGIKINKIVGLWNTNREELQRMRAVCCCISIPVEKRQYTTLKKEYFKDWHLNEFRNLDELRRLKPKSLSTTRVVSASYIGINLKERERLVLKTLPCLGLDFKLSKGQLELLRKNIKYIREAVV